MVCLLGLEKLSNELVQNIYDLVNQRKYFDSQGNERVLSDSVLLMASLATDLEDSQGPRLTRDHWLCSGFEHQLPIDPYIDRAHLLDVCQEMAHSLGCKLEGDIDLLFFQISRDIPGHLNQIYEIMAKISCWPQRETITIEELKDAMLSDTQVILNRILYRGNNISQTHYNEWAKQFGDKRYLAFHILSKIASSYYITSGEYHHAIQHIIERFQLPNSEGIIFCEWQSQGNSAPRIANEMKNQAKWKLAKTCQVSLNQDPITVSGLEVGKKYSLIIVDDFVGSGRTLKKIFKNPKTGILGLLESYPQIGLYIGIIAGFQNALQEVNEIIKPFSNRVKLIPYKIFYDTDRCFTENSKIFPDVDRRGELKDFCLQTAEKYFRLPRDNRLGFSEIASLVIFPDTVPNNTLPIIWYDNNPKWLPLFPASNMLTNHNAVQ